MAEIAQERWRPVVGYYGYDISDQGRARSWRCNSGKLRSLPRLLRLTPNHEGYLRIGMVDPDGKKMTRFVHQLVLEAFVGPCPPGHEVRHFPDRDRTNNSVENLRWGTVKENAADRDFHGTAPRGLRSGAYTKPECRVRGSRHGMSKLTEGSARVISMLMSLPQEDRPTHREVAEVFSVTTGLVGHVKRGLVWGHVTGAQAHA